MFEIAVKIDCENDRCGRCAFVDVDHGAYEGFCWAFEIMLEPDEAERYSDGGIETFFRCQECLQAELAD